MYVKNNETDYRSADTDPKMFGRHGSGNFKLLLNFYYYLIKRYLYEFSIFRKLRYSFIMMQNSKLIDSAGDD